VEKAGPGVPVPIDARCLAAIVGRAIGARVIASVEDTQFRELLLRIP
jgi:hypothetical protein